MIVPLLMESKNNATPENINANILASVARGYKLLKPETCKGVVSIVGAGPSLATTYKAIKGDVIACNSAHDFLIRKGVIPRFAMFWDANPVTADLFTPHPGVTYLIASRCHPSVFQKLEGFDVHVWHAMGDADVSTLLMKQGRNEILIAGGSSSVLRAMYVAMSLGYREEMHLFGVDSSYSGEETHVDGSLVEQKKLTMCVAGRWFDVAPWMVIQGQDFKYFAPIIRRAGVRLVVHGEGLIPYVASFMDCETPDIHVGWLEKHVIRPLNEVKVIYQMLRLPQLLGASNAGI